MRITGLPPVVLAATFLTPGTGTLAAAGHAPTIQATAHTQRMPTTGGLTLTGLQSVLGTAASITPPAGALAITGVAPSLLRPTSITPTAGALAASGVAPTLRTDRRLTPSVGSAAYTGSAPSLFRQDSRTPTAGSLALTGVAPTLQIPGQTQRTPDSGALALTGAAPTLLVPIRVTPATGSLALTGYAPTFPGAGVNTDITPPAGSLWFGDAPQTVIVPQTGALWFGDPAAGDPNQRITPQTGALAITGHASLGGGDRTVTPPAGALSMAPPTLRWAWTPTGGPAVTEWRFEYGRSPGLYTNYTVLTDETLRAVVARDVITAGPGAWYVSIVAVADGVLGTRSAELLVDTGIPHVLVGPPQDIKIPVAGALAFTGQPAIAVHDHRLTPAAGSLALSGVAPTLYEGTFLTRIITPPAGALGLTGDTPSLAHAARITPTAGGLPLTGVAPTLDLPRTITPPAGALAFTAYAPGIYPILCHPVISSGGVHSLVAGGLVITG